VTQASARSGCVASAHQNVSGDEEDVDGFSVTSSLTRSDAGLYTCVVKNIAGHVAHNVSLFIEGQTPLIASAKLLYADHG